MKELDLATNVYGRINQDIKDRLLKLLENPTNESWDECHGLLINRWMTLWNAVIAMDPTFPQSVPYSSKRRTVWPRVPTRALLESAIRFATH